MRLASYSPFAWLVFAALGCAVACGDDDDDTGNMGSSGSSNQGGEGTAGSKSNTAGKAGSGTNAGGEGSTPAMDSQLCTDLGGPKGIDAVVRGDGKTSKTDAFNGFKFDKDGRQASVLLNVATDPCIGQQFASLLTPERADALEHLAQCLSLFVQNAAGCAVAYDMDKAGKACKDMKAAHVGRNITEEDYTALVIDAATALIAAGVAQDSPQFMAVAGALTADDLKRDVITNDAAGYSKPGAMCEAAGGAENGAAGMSSGGAGRGAVKAGLRKLIRAAAALGAVAALATVVIGVAHTPWGRPLLRLPLLSALAQQAGCPVGNIEPAAYETVRATKLQSEVGSEPARSRPALGFTLGQTSRAEVERWITSVEASCGAGFVASVLECRDVKQLGELPLAHVRLQFDGSERLVSVDLFREQADADSLVDSFIAASRRLDDRVGPATSSIGAPSVALATSSPFRLVARQYGYRDYVAKLTLLNLGKRGLRLREQYSFLPPPA